MADLHAINDAINKRAGRKLLPSILVSLFLIAELATKLTTKNIANTQNVMFNIIIEKGEFICTLAPPSGNLLEELIKNAIKKNINEMI